MGYARRKGGASKVDEGREGKKEKKIGERKKKLLKAIMYDSYWFMLGKIRH